MSDATEQLRRIADKAETLLEEGEYEAVLEVAAKRDGVEGPFSDEEFFLNDKINKLVVKAIQRSESDHSALEHIRLSENGSG